MLQKGICAWCLWIVITTITTPVWSGEPSEQPGIKKQRVSPKLLREAMALPEYKGAPASPPPVEHLEKLSEKLKSSGDKDGCELLQRFIQEHQRLVQQVSRRAESNQVINVRCQAIDVDVERLPKNSILHKPIAETEAFCKELDRAIEAKFATRLFEPITLSTHLNEPGRFHQGGEIGVPSSDGSPARQFREIGTTLEVVVSPISGDRHSVELTIEFIKKDEATVANASETTKPHLHHLRLQSTFEARTGETDVQLSPLGAPGHQIYILTRLLPKK